MVQAARNAIALVVGVYVHYIGLFLYIRILCFSATAPHLDVLPWRQCGCPPKNQRGRGCRASPGSAKRACCARALLLRRDGIASCAWRAALAPQPQKRGSPPSRTQRSRRRSRWCHMRHRGNHPLLHEDFSAAKTVAPFVALLAQVIALHAWASSLGLSHPESNMFANPKVR